MRELEASLQQFGEFLLNGQLVRPSAAPHFVRWVRRLLSRQASDEPLADQVRRFCDDLERHGGVEDGTSAKPNRPFASPPSTSSNDRTGITGRPAAR